MRRSRPSCRGAGRRQTLVSVRSEIWLGGHGQNPHGGAVATGNPQRQGHEEGATRGQILVGDEVDQDLDLGPLESPKTVCSTVPPTSAQLWVRRPESLLRMCMHVRQLFDSTSSTYTYLLVDRPTNSAAIIDSVREQNQRDLRLINELGLTLEYVLETHVHADHITGAAALRKATGAKVGVGAGGADHTDVELSGGDLLELGAARIEVLATPGHDGRDLRIAMVRASRRSATQSGWHWRLPG
jgi:hypothetical protein